MKMRKIPAMLMLMCTGSPGVAQETLPPRMEEGVQQLEQGVEDVGEYSRRMAEHIAKEGLRGYLAMPQDLRDDGKALGAEVGSGIQKIMDEVGQEIVDEAHGRQ